MTPVEQRRLQGEYVNSDRGAFVKQRKQTPQDDI